MLFLLPFSYLTKQKSPVRGTHKATSRFKYAAYTALRLSISNNAVAIYTKHDAVLGGMGGPLRGSPLKQSTGLFWSDCQKCYAFSQCAPCIYGATLRSTNLRPPRRTACAPSYTHTSCVRRASARCRGHSRCRACNKQRPTTRQYPPRRWY